jgi:hypothetical protein
MMRNLPNMQREGLWKVLRRSLRVGAARRRLFPRIDDRRSCFVEVVSVSRDNCEPVVKRGCGNNQIWLRIGMPGFAAFFHQNPPAKQDVLGHRQNSLIEHGPYCVRKPAIQFVAAFARVQPLDAEAELGQCDRADVKLIKRTGRNKGQNLGSGLGRRISDKILVSRSHGIYSDTSRTGRR